MRIILFEQGSEARHDATFPAGIKTETRGKSLFRVRLGRMRRTIERLSSVLAQVAISTIALRTLGRARSYG